jgi:uroporphyrinogen-III synthase
MLALVTRPREDSEGVAAELRSRGLDVMVEPLLDILPVAGASVDAAGIQGILATSANGIRALARLLPDRTLPVWSVGDASARVARELGYLVVESAGGDVDTLAELVRARVDPAGGALLHAAGTAVAGDLAGRLGEGGFEVRRVVLYQAHAAGRASDALTAALTNRRVDIALFFSPRTAATFVTLITKAGLAEPLARIAGYALSANVARELAALPWRCLRVAAEPTQAALLAALDDDLQRGRPLP